ncbi:MAG TPA: hypothetical protein VLA96_13945 [Terriglobales bacterium]|jgi:hypothetical protein|nr:hypothetical protein [Terriglobales bacterium]
MGLRRSLRRAILADRSELIVQLRSGILRGEFSETDLIEGRWREISAATGGALFEDSLDAVEFLMAFEEEGIANATVGDLLHLLEKQQAERNRP